MRWQDESWQPKSLMSRQPGSSLGQVPTPRGGPRSGKGSSGVRNFSYEVVADASSDMVGDGLARAPSPAPSCSRDRPCPHSNLSAVAAAGVCPPQLTGRLRTAAHRCPGTAGRHEGAARSYRRLPATQRLSGLCNHLSRRCRCRCRCCPAQPSQCSAAAAATRPAHCARRSQLQQSARHPQGRERRREAAPFAPCWRGGGTESPPAAARASGSAPPRPALHASNQGFQTLERPGASGQPPPPLSHPRLITKQQAAVLRKGTWPRSHCGA